MSEKSSTDGNGLDESVHTWSAAAGKDLQDLYDQQRKIVNKLEGALVKWTLKAPADDGMHKPTTGETARKDIERNGADPKYRPTSRFVSFKMIGRKVDVITYQTEQLANVRRDIESKQGEYNSMSHQSAPAQFIEFKTQAAAAQAYKYHSGKLSKHSCSRAIGSAPDDIIWKNLEMSKAQRTARGAIVVAIICLMILFWGPITAIIGLISNVNYLTNEVPFLGFINNVPQVFLGAITGLLPAILLSLLLSLVPAIMRFLFKLAGCVTNTEVELKTQRWYFVFQVIQVFLITTLSSGASAVATVIVQNPAEAVNILASNLPKASNFYISYLILQGIATPAKEILQIGQLAMIYVGKILDKTPRKMLARYTKVRPLKWGTLYPKFTTFVVIAISYSCIAPLILGFAALAFALLYIAFRYDVLYSTDTTVLDTHGQAYTKALQQMTTGIYLSELCLIGLMAITSANNTNGVGPLVLNIILLVVTIILHIVFNSSVAMLNRRSADLATQYAEQTEDRTTEDSGPSFSRAMNEVFTSPTTKSTQDPTFVEKLTYKFTSIFHKLLRVPTPDLMPSHFSSEARELSKEEYKNAYVHPAARVWEDQPLFWLPADQNGKTPAGIASEVEKEDLTTRGAWIADDNKVHVDWREAQSDGQEEEMIRKTPYWEDVRRF